jgi:hypothetical protein
MRRLCPLGSSLWSLVVVFFFCFLLLFLFRLFLFIGKVLV